MTPFALAIIRVVYIIRFFLYLICMYILLFKVIFLRLKNEDMYIIVILHYITDYV